MPKILLFLTLIVQLLSCSASEYETTDGDCYFADICPNNIKVSLSYGNVYGVINIEILNLSKFDISFDRRFIGYKSEINGGTFQGGCESGSMVYLGKTINANPIEKYAVRIAKDESITFSLTWRDSYKLSKDAENCELVYSLVTKDLVNEKSYFMKSNILKLEKK